MLLLKKQLKEVKNNYLPTNYTDTDYQDQSSYKKELQNDAVEYQPKK